MKCGYIIYNYEENTWSIGSLIRYAWLDAGIEDQPIASGIDSNSNLLFDQETGFDDYTQPMSNVFVESADLDVADGENFAFVKRIIPDIAFIKELGATNSPVMNIVLKRRDFPGQALTTDSTTQVTESSTINSLRSRARQVVLRFESDDDGASGNQLGYKWRIGSTRLDLQQSGRR